MASGAQGVIRHRSQGVENEETGGGGIGQSGAGALTPVPATAGHAGIVTPDNFASARVLHDCFAVGEGFEGLIAESANEAC